MDASTIRINKRMTHSSKHPVAPGTLQKASTQQRYTIHASDLPLCCPMPNMRLWDAHPRVYLPIEETGQETCPYCGAQFVLATD